MSPAHPVGPPALRAVGGEPTGTTATSKATMRQIPRARPVVLLALLALPLLAAACGDDDQAARTGDDPAGDGGGSSTGGVIITVDVHGGFVPVESNVANTADVVVLGDGTVISPAPTIAIFPGPALQSFQVGRVDEAEVEELIAAIEELDPDADYSEQAAMQIADAPDTTLTLRRGDDTVAISAYALGMADDTGPRAELAAVVDRITGLTDPSGEEAYEPTALRVHDVTDLAGEPPSPTTAPSSEAPTEPTGRILDWPLPHDGRECTVVDDANEVAAVLDVLAGATQLDWFATDAGERRLVAVPVLPGDPGCPGGP